jgi:DNA modification methylase
MSEPGIPQIELRDIESLIPYAYNARTHNGAQVTMIRNSLVEWGWTNAVLADVDGVVAGHGRIMGAAEAYKLGIQLRFPNGALIPMGKVPIIDCTGWTVAQRKAYILADNQLAARAGWDVALLKAEVDELVADGFDIEMTGFDDAILADLFKDLPELPPEGAGGDPDDAPPAPEVPKSVLGDVWECGPHRVMCGSSLSVEDWQRLMDGEIADACWTDPPYNVDIGAKNKSLDRADGGKRSKTGGIANDKMAAEAFREFLLGFFSATIQQLKAGAPIYVAHPDKEALNFRAAFDEAGFKFSSCIIWKKNMMVLGQSDYQPIHEPILYGWKPGTKHRWYGGRKNTSVMDMGDGGPFTQLPDGRWQIKVGDSVMIVDGAAQVQEHPSSVLVEAKPSKSGLHPTQKPVALVERMLKQSARARDIVIDGFGGSGSTLVAADRLGMYARLMELDPKFTDVIVRRWEMLTGRRAVHAVTGEMFPRDDEPRSERLAESPLDTEPF